MKKIVVANNKGGVGKTTIATQIAHSMAAGGKSVVCVDLDNQGNLSGSLEEVRELGSARTIVEDGNVISVDLDAGQIGLVKGDADLAMFNWVGPAWRASCQQKFAAAGGNFLNKQSKAIVAGGAALLAVILVFYPRGQEPLPHAFGVIVFIHEPSDAPRNSEWLAHAKYDFLTRDPAPTHEDAEGYAIFVQKYSEERISQIAAETQ